MTTIPTPFYGGGQVQNPADIIYVHGAPGANLIQYVLGTLAVNVDTGAIYGLSAKTGGTATWSVLSNGGSGTVGSITGDSGTAVPNAGVIHFTGGAGPISFAGAGNTITANFAAGSLLVSNLQGNSGTATPAAGIIQLVGTANQLNAVGAGNVVTFSIPAAFQAPGSITAATSITATNGNIISTGGQVIAGGDNAGSTGTNFTITNVSSATIGAGVGSVNMSSGNAATNNAWIKVYIGAVAHWIPAWATNSP